MTPAAVLAVAVIGAAIVIMSQRHENSRGPHTTLPTSSTQTAQRTYGPPVALPFNGVESLGGPAVDAAGNVYVTDFIGNRVLKLPVGSSTFVVLPFTNLNLPRNVAVDGAGNLYVTDSDTNGVIKLAAGSSTPVLLSFTGLKDPAGMAADASGDLYLVDNPNGRVMKLAAGSSTPVVLPFTGLNHPFGVAVDSTGNLYVADAGNSRVVKLAAGSNNQSVLPMNPPPDDLNHVAVDAEDNVYVAATQLIKLAAGSFTPTVLWRGQHTRAWDVVVDAGGNVYFTEVLHEEAGRVIKLPVK